MALYFEKPVLLVLAVFIPLLGLIIFSGIRTRKEELGGFWLSGVRLLSFRTVGHISVLLSLLLIIISISGPVVGTETIIPAERKADIVIAIDGSASMKAEAGEKVKVSRFDMARNAAKELLGRIEGTRTGLVLFSDSAVTVSSLTRDENAISLFMERLEPGIIARGGTSIGAAIKASVGLLGDDTRKRAVILFTDGGEGSLTKDPAVMEALRKGIRIYTVGIGPEGPLGIPVRTESGRLRGYKLDESNKRVLTSLNKEGLTGVARLTGGEYYSVSGKVDGALDGLAGRLMTMGEVEKVREEVLNYSRWFRGLLIVSMVLLFAGRFLPITKIRKISFSDAEIPAYSGSVPSGTLIFLVLLSVLLSAMAPRKNFDEEFSKGARLYIEGRYEDSIKSFKEAERIKPGDADTLFSLGASQYRAGFFEDAIEVFERVIETDERELLHRAYYDLGCALFRESRFDKAYEAFRQALVLKPDDEDARFNLEVCLNILRMAFDKFSFGAGETPDALGAEGDEGNELDIFIDMAMKAHDKEKRARKFMESLGEVDAEGVEISPVGETRVYSKRETLKVLEGAAEDEQALFIEMLRKKAPIAMATGGFDW